MVTVKICCCNVQNVDNKLINWNHTYSLYIYQYIWTILYISNTYVLHTFWSGSQIQIFKKNTANPILPSKRMCVLLCNTVQNTYLIILINTYQNRASLILQLKMIRKEQHENYATVRHNQFDIDYVDLITSHLITWQHLINGCCGHHGN